MTTKLLKTAGQAVRFVSVSVLLIAAGTGCISKNRTDRPPAGSVAQVEAGSELEPEPKPEPKHEPPGGGWTDFGRNVFVKTVRIDGHVYIIAVTADKIVQAIDVAHSASCSCGQPVD